jgi:hypothetical protein
LRSRDHGQKKDEKRGPSFHGFMTPTFMRSTPDKYQP